MSCIFNTMGLVALVIYTVWVFYTPIDLMPMRVVFMSGLLAGGLGVSWISVKFLTYDEYVNRKSKK